MARLLVRIDEVTARIGRAAGAAASIGEWRHAHLVRELAGVTGQVGVLVEHTRRLAAAPAQAVLGEQHEAPAGLDLAGVVAAWARAPAQPISDPALRADLDFLAAVEGETATPAEVLGVGRLVGIAEPSVGRVVSLVRLMRELDPEARSA